MYLLTIMPRGQTGYVTEGRHVFYQPLSVYETIFSVPYYKWTERKAIVAPLCCSAPSAVNRKGERGYKDAPGRSHARNREDDAGGEGIYSPNCRAYKRYKCINRQCVYSVSLISMYYGCSQCLEDAVAYYRIKNRHLINLIQAELAYTTPLSTTSGTRRVGASLDGKSVRTK